MVRRPGLGGRGVDPEEDTEVEPTTQVPEPVETPFATVDKNCSRLDHSWSAQRGASAEGFLSAPCDVCFLLPSTVLNLKWLVLAWLSMFDDTRGLVCRVFTSITLLLSTGFAFKFVVTCVPKICLVFLIFNSVFSKILRPPSCIVCSSVTLEKSLMTFTNPPPPHHDPSKFPQIL